MTVENIPIKDLKPYKANTRKHGRKSVEVIANSIREFGFSDPVGIWGPNLHLARADKLALSSTTIWANLRWH